MCFSSLIGVLLSFTSSLCISSGFGSGLTKYFSSALLSCSPRTVPSVCSIVAFISSCATSRSANSASRALSGGVHALRPLFQSVSVDCGNPNALANLYSLPAITPAIVMSFIASLFCGMAVFLCMMARTPIA